MTGAPLLEIISVSAGYGLLQVLRGVDLTVEPGQIVALLGPNGHGKTTLLRVISGLLPVSDGQFNFAGEGLATLRPDQIVARGLIHIPQGDLIFADMTVQENLLLGAFVKDAYQVRQQQLEKVFAMFPRLRERSTQVASTLSGGERRMLAIGRGLMSRAKLLMLDEPSLGLAPLVIDEIYATIDRLKKAGYAILLVEENPERVMDIADRVYLMDHGQIIWSGGGADMHAYDALFSTYLGV